MVVLYELHLQPRGGELALLPRFEKKSPRVAKHPGADQHDTRDFGGFELHASGLSLCDFKQVRSVPGFCERTGKALELPGVYVARPERNLLGSVDLQSLTSLDRLDERGCLKKRLMRTSIQPSRPTSEDLDPERAPLEVHAIDVRDLELAPRGWLQRCCDLKNLIVVKVQSGDRKMRLRMGRLLLNVECFAPLVELHHAISLRIADTVCEDGSPCIVLYGGAQLIRKAMAVEDVVPENEGNTVVADEPTPNDERLRKAFRPRLLSVRQGDAPFAPVPEQSLILRQVLRSRDQKDVANS